MEKQFDCEGFKREISGVSFEKGREFVASRSKDYYWHSPECFLRVTRFCLTSIAN